MREHVLSLRFVATMLLAGVDIVLLITPALAQQDSTSTENSSRLMRTIKSRGQVERWGFVYVPAVYYSSENGFGAGGSLLRYFNLTGDTLYPTTMKLHGRITTKARGKVEVTFDQGWGRELRHASRSKVFFSNLANRFYGVGPDTPAENEELYRPEHVRAYFEHFRRFTRGFRLGFRLEGEHLRMIDVADGGILAADSIAGSSSDGVGGAGFLADWDSRNRRFSPTSGRHYQAYLMAFIGQKSEDRDFVVYHLDLRRYISLGHERVLSAQFFLYGIADGEPPFWKLAALGGRAHTRGYRRARYLDRHLVAAQAEYRFPVAWRFGMVVFGGAANVGQSWQKMAARTIRPTGGVGLRFLLGDQDQIRGRFDVAFGQNSIRLYLEIGEAF